MVQSLRSFTSSSISVDNKGGRKFVIPPINFGHLTAVSTRRGTTPPVVLSGYGLFVNRNPVIAFVFTV